jgi:hypothetical protein
VNKWSTGHRSATHIKESLQWHRLIFKAFGRGKVQKKVHVFRTLKTNLVKEKKKKPVTLVAK